MIGKCAYPSTISTIQVVEYVAPALEGSEVRFSCTPRLVLTQDLMCQCVLVMENGNQTQSKPGATV